MTTQRLDLREGIWTCPGCEAQLGSGDLSGLDAGANIEHSDGCPQVTVAFLDVVPDGYLLCPADDCAFAEVVMLPDGTLVCAAADCGARRGTWVRR